MKLTGLSSQFKQEMAITLRNSLAWFIMGTAVLMIVFVRFVIPEDFHGEETIFFHDETEGRGVESMMVELGYNEEFILDTSQDVEERIANEQGTLGVIFSGSFSNPHITLISNGSISPQRLNVIHASIESMLAPLLGLERGDRGYNLEFLREQMEPVARNLTAVPPLLVFEVLITGFLLVAVLMFQEKQEKTISAYRVTPGTAWGYILSKVMVFIVISLVYGIVLTIFTVGVSVNWGMLLLILALGAVFYTLLGIIVAVFFDNISQWFFIGLSVLLLNMLPIISYAVPTFSPGFIGWIPSYPIITGVRDVLFPTGRTVLPVIWLLLFLIGVAYIVSLLLVNRKLMKEGR